MRAWVVPLCLLGLVSSARSEAAGRLGPYGSDGPNTVKIVSLTVPSPSGAFSTTAYVPSGAGPFPLVIFSPGFFQKGIAYPPYAQRLGSWGIITLLRDDPNFFGEVSRGDDFSRPDNVKVEAMTDRMVFDVSYEVSTWLHGCPRRTPIRAARSPARWTQRASVLPGILTAAGSLWSWARLCPASSKASSGSIRSTCQLVPPHNRSSRASASPSRSLERRQTGSPVLPGGATTRHSTAPPLRLLSRSPRLKPTTPCLRIQPTVRGAGPAGLQEPQTARRSSLTRSGI